MGIAIEVPVHLPKAVIATSGIGREGVGRLYAKAGPLPGPVQEDEGSAPTAAIGTNAIRRALALTIGPSQVNDLTI